MEIRRGALLKFISLISLSLVSVALTDGQQIDYRSQLKNRPAITDQDLSFNGSVSSACAHAVSYSLQLILTKMWDYNGTCAANLYAVQGGGFAPTTGHTTNLIGSFDGDLTQHFSVSGGGTFSSSVAFTMKGGLYPQWFGANGDGTTDSAPAFQAAVNQAVNLNQTVLSVPPGSYVLMPTNGIGVLTTGATLQVNCLGLSAGTGSVKFIAGADNMILWKWPPTNEGIAGMNHCLFDLGESSHSFTAVDGVVLDQVVSPAFSNNIYIGIPLNHAGFKGGGLILGTVGPDTYSGSGRCIDLQAGYSSSSVYYGANFTTFNGALSSGGCHQGYRASGNLYWNNMNWEASTLLSGARAIFDFSDSQTSLTVEIAVIMHGGHSEAGDFTVNGQSAVYVDGGKISINGAQFIGSNGSGVTSSNCIFVDAVNRPLLLEHIDSTIMRGCNTGLMQNAVPLSQTPSGLAGGINVDESNLFEVNNTAGCSFGTGILNSIKTARTAMHLACPDINIGTIRSSGYTGFIPPQRCFVAYVFSVDGGAQGLITPANNCVFPPNAIIKDFTLEWSQPTSSGSASVSIGIAGNGGAGPDILQASTAIASLHGIVQSAIVAGTASTYKVIGSSGGAVTVTVSGADLTSGSFFGWVDYLVSF